MNLKPSVNCISNNIFNIFPKINTYMKTTLLLTFLNILSGVQAQTVYDFSSDPLSNGWTYYDDYASNPYPGFEYDAVNNRIDYQLNTTVDISILHTQLSSSLSADYCVSFQITPTNNSNYNTFFPLILTPYEVTGTDLHPWRQNAISASTAGPMQDIDFLAIEVFSSELRFFNRDGANLTGSSIQSMSPQFQMQNNLTYWVKLEISNTTTATVSVYQDAGFNTMLGSTSFTIPALDAMNHLYIANSNGNSSCTQFGYLDDYRIKLCSGLGTATLQASDMKKELVKIVDMMGRETENKPNTPLIYMYSDGSTEKVMHLKN